MNLPNAIERLRNVIRRQHKGICVHSPRWRWRSGSVVELARPGLDGGERQFAATAA